MFHRVALLDAPHSNSSSPKARACKRCRYVPIVSAFRNRLKSSPLLSKRKVVGHGSTSKVRTLTRLQRCDSNRPSCAACIASNISEQCCYDDSPIKTPTQRMQQRIFYLEQHIRELEGIPPPTRVSESGSSSPTMSTAQTSQFGVRCVCGDRSLISLTIDVKACPAYHLQLHHP
jgi:hypothetical protein